MELRRALAGYGLHEGRGLSLVSASSLKYEPGGGAAQPIKNPLGEEHALLRPSLVPGLVEALARNTRAGERSIRLFEIGRTFSSDGAGERTRLAILLSGPMEASSWRGGNAAAADFFHVKGLVERLVGGSPQFARLEPTATLALRASISLDGGSIGTAGQLWPQQAASLDATAPVVFAEIEIDAWLDSISAPKRYSEIPRFPAVSRDVAFFAPAGLEHSRVLETLQNPPEPLLAGVEIFDIFADPTGEKVPADKKSVAYSLTYRSAERTLVADEVNAAHARLKDRLKSSLGVQFRE
jgi:phenylalanyl-tRNA synthetase beta chain